MHNIKIVSFRIKKIFIPACICLFTAFLLIFSSSNLSSAKSGLLLWATSVVPSLLPFFIATELLGYTNVISILGKMLNKLMRPIFNVPGEGAFPFIMGIISGYPMGAKIIANFKSKGICTNDECERLISFTNNSGPLFIIGTVGIGLFGNVHIGILLFITHLLACITVGFIFRWWKCNTRKRSAVLENNNNNLPVKVSMSNLGEVLSASIISAINTIFLIGGFIVLFSVIISILKNSRIIDFAKALLSPVFNIVGISNNYIEAFVCGIVELTNGVSAISLIANANISTSIILCAFLLGFGGISVSLQILSITSKAKISIKPYLIGKLLQGAFATLYTYIFLNI